MTSESTPVPVPAAPRRDAAEGRAGWRMLLALIIGFALPVLACYGFIVASAFALQIVSFGAGASPAGVRSTPGSGPGVAIIRVEGVILSGEAGPFDAGIAASRTIVEHIERAAQDGQVKAIVLAVNSPGGGVAASDEIYHALQAAGKPIVVVMGDLAASGGYYISMAADWIVANPNSLTGSIGVISEFPNAEGLLEKVGLSFVVVTSGPRKDFGSPYREMSDAERAYWQVIIDETHESFVQVVADGRQMSVAAVWSLADGGVFTGRQALEAGLVDELGYQEDAVRKAAELGGITGEPRIIEYERTPTLFDLLTGFATPRSLLPTPAEIINLLGHPTLSARWIGP